MKVLVTIGTMKEKKFTRLFQFVDRLCEEGILQGKDVVAQVGEDKYISRYYKCVDMVPREEFNDLIEASDVIITHGGTGSVISCLKAKKKVIIVPRQSIYNEHYDDHQLEIAKAFAKKGYTLTALTFEDLKQCLINIQKFAPVEFHSNNKRMIDLICQFIEK